VHTFWDLVDPAAVVPGGPVRRFRSFKGQRHYSGLLATMGRHLVYVSLLELSRLLLADFDATLVGIAAQQARWIGPFLAVVSSPALQQ
jgi:hypothetical protein